MDSKSQSLEPSPIHWSSSSDWADPLPPVSPWHRWQTSTQIFGGLRMVWAARSGAASKINTAAASGTVSGVAARSRCMLGARRIGGVAIMYASSVRKPMSMVDKHRR